MHFRDARPDDQHQVQALVAAVLAEYGLRFDLTSTDADLVDLAASYPPGRAAFIVLEQAGRIVGTGAFAPWDELTCEIKKMYLRRSVRGRGWGRRLLVELERRARAAGYRRAWLETNSVLVE
ncbi:MAG: GNAT family N-acetyltransferase, partial [Phycisphaerae bacterium]